MKLIILLSLLISNTLYSQTTAKVIGIKDGDTIVVLLKDKTQQTLRLAEVDCPESGQAFGKSFSSSLDALFWIRPNQTSKTFAHWRLIG